MAKRRRNSAIPGGGTGKNSAYMFKTSKGYKAVYKEPSPDGQPPADAAPGAAVEYGAAKSFQGQDALNALMGNDAFASGTSIFDPVLAELAYTWFCPPCGVILDPFAGGSVRGIVASKLGRPYVGVELSTRQVAANRAQGQQICANDATPPVWVNGDSTQIETLAAGVQADMVFSCPPYGSLEVYSSDPRDLSNMPYEKFLEGYRQIIAASCRMLKPNRFAAFVVGEIRDQKTGWYRNFVGHTVEAFQAAGLGYYNSAILVTSVGSLPMRAGKQFSAGRKLGKTHQDVLVFVKGDWRQAAKACGDLDI